ncbi:alginate lyase family protein [Peribacillus sp. NPDC101481]|uniref:alginate lyase family protein n=1 Tax=Peribacillus sp. NPDC101481 TaxID=3364403 RepID=UPI0038169004
MLDLKQKFKNLKKMPLNKAVKKIITKSCEVPYKQMRKQLIKSRPINMKDSYFYEIKPNCKYFIDIEDKDTIVQRINELTIIDDIIRDADKICSHTFNLLGSGDVKLGKYLPWNKDFKTNFVWENKFNKDIKIVDFSNKADVKVPWELSRFQHLFTLGKAYWVTGDEKYAVEFKDEIEDWIEMNPVEMSVNWTCTMDVGIRAVNWIAASFFFKKSRSIDKNFWLEFNKSLYLHGRFITKNLENKSVHTGNHYLSNIVGLVWLGLYFDSFTVNDVNRKNNPKKWLEFGLSELEKEMFVQNNPDGTNYEASTSYHRLVTELFLLTTILCNKNNIHFSKDYMIRLEKMCDFIMNITKPNGLSPIIGDADDGRLLILSNYSNWIRNDFRHLLGIAGELFERDDFRYYGKEYREDTLWIHKNFKKDVEIPKPLTSIEYRDGGYFILRNKRVYCCIRCGELSFRGEGVHSHNDQLSFELNVDGEDFIVDPGTYIYTADYKMRNLFRSTSMHNTVQIEDFEQNDFEEKNLFNMAEQTNSRLVSFDQNHFCGEHFGFYVKNGGIHERTVCIKSDVIKIEDNIKNSKYNNKFKQCFNIPKEIKIKKVEINKYLLTSNKSTLEVEFSTGLISLQQSYISNQYGLKSISNQLLGYADGNKTQTISFRIMRD